MNKSYNYVRKYFDMVFESSAPTTKENERLTEIIQLIPDSVKTILDAGCGDCRLSNLIQSVGQFAVTSLDLSMRGLRNARTRPVNGMIYKLPFPDNCFDLVICSEVLEHLPGYTYSETLNELLRVSNRFILITAPHNENLLHQQLKCNHCGEVIHTWGHLRKFKKDSFDFLTKMVLTVNVFEIGSVKTERSLSWLYLIGRKIGKHYDPPNNTICINCGKNISKRNNSNLIGYLSFRLIWRINKYFPDRKNEKTWIAFLIEL